MPTPFQHLVYADLVLSHPALPSPLRRLLTAHLGPYLLGTTAADVQVITGQDRVETHFYRLSTGRDGSPVGKMLATLEPLPGPRSPEHAAFLVGYAVHLVWDEIWAWDVFVPYYRDGEHWPDRKSYFVHHNALRVWLDQKAQAHLQDWAGLTACLRAPAPCDWLPFAPDWALVRWRDWLVAQLEDPSTVQTADVFAERLRVPVAALASLVSEMEAGRYDVVAGLAAALEAYEATALGESVLMLCGHDQSGLASMASVPVTRTSELRDSDFAPILGSGPHRQDALHKTNTSARERS